MLGKLDADVLTLQHLVTNFVIQAVEIGEEDAFSLFNFSKDLLRTGSPGGDSLLEFGDKDFVER